MALCAAALIPAQVTEENVTVSGPLTIVQGRIALKSGEVTYITAGLIRYAGFIDGLKEGAQVTLEGNALAWEKDAKTKHLRIRKMTLNGKAYDMAPPDAGRRENRKGRMGPPPGYGWQGPGWNFRGRW
jgi:lipopolysaccharide export system protein LptA